MGRYVVCLYSAELSRSAPQGGDCGESPISWDLIYLSELLEPTMLLLLPLLPELIGLAFIDI